MTDSPEQKENKQGPQPRNFPLGEWNAVLDNYDSYPYDTRPDNIRYHVTSKIIPITIQDVGSADISVHRTLNYGEALDPDNTQDFYFDGVNEKSIKRGNSDIISAEKFDETPLMDIGLNFEDRRHLNHIWFWRLLFPTGTILVKEYRPLEDEDAFGFTNFDWINPATGEKFIELLIPESQNILGSILMRLDTDHSISTGMPQQPEPIQPNTPISGGLVGRRK